MILFFGVKSLEKRDDRKDEFLDTVIFGTILNKIYNLERYKKIIKDKLHKIGWERGKAYITINAENLEYPKSYLMPKRSS